MDPEPHGGSLAEARARFPSAPEPLLDLSTGVNPTSYPCPAARLDRLPEPTDLARLEAAAARAYGLPAGAAAVAGPGTGLLMALIATLSGCREVAIVGPTYAGHARAWSAAGARIRDVCSIDAASGRGAVVLTRPNNPDGRIVPAALLQPAPGRLLVVDEAFADLEPCAGDLPGQTGEPGLVLLRSFGKTYGLPGVRLAFACGADPLLARLRAALGPWPISAPALAAGRAARPAPPGRAPPRPARAPASARLDALLLASGLSIEGGTRLFRLASHPDAHRIWQRLGEAGIMTRRFAHAPAHLRFGIPPGIGLARLTATLEMDGLHQ